MRLVWKIVLVLVVAAALSLRCIHSKKTKTKSLKKLSHIGHRKVASQQRAQTGQKKNAVQPTNEQVAAMTNPERLDSSETEELNNLQNFNKQYINNEMAAETAILADQGIDDDSALKISNMAALPGAPNGPVGANAAIKAKINSGTHQGASPGPTQGYDPNAYLYDENSWPEYRIHDSDYSNFRSFQMNNLMNGENSDMMYERPNSGPYSANYQDTAGGGGGGGGMPFREQRRPFGGGTYPGGASHGMQESSHGMQESSHGMQQASPMKTEAMHAKPNVASSVSKGGAAADSSTAGTVKVADKSAAGGGIKPQGGGVNPAAPAASQQVRQPTSAAAKAVNTAPEPVKDAPAPKQQQHQEQKQQEPSPPAQQQQQQQDKANSDKLAASVVQAAASMPPKAIASLVNSLVAGKGAGVTLGQIQSKIAGSVSKSIPQDINQGITKLQKVSKSKEQ